MKSKADRCSSKVIVSHKMVATVLKWRSNADLTKNNRQAMDSILKLVAMVISVSTLLAVVGPSESVGTVKAEPPSKQRRQLHEYENLAESAEFWKNLRAQDTCGTIYTSKSHGYDVVEHKLITKDRYEITLHRLVHQSDWKANGGGSGSPNKKKRKPYLLVHGLIGSSASYVTNVPADYKPPPETFSASQSIKEVLESKLSSFEHDWQSTSDRVRLTFGNEDKSKWEKLKETRFAFLNDIIFESDSLSFAPEFRQAYRKYDLPRNVLQSHVSSSLAFTLSNFGYDVWLVNLRGNRYSRNYNGPLNAAKDEYWNFNVDSIITEDLAAAINYVKVKVDCDEPIGLVTFSYSSIFALGLLSKFPTYQESVQPIVMLAPTLLTGAHVPSKSSKKSLAIRAAGKVLLGHNGPFPSLGRAELSRDHKLESLACLLPIASKLCNLFETILHGRSKEIRSVRNLIGFGPEREKTALIERDASCGQTSKAILHNIIDNLSTKAINPNYSPWIARRKPLAPRNVRRSVILMHSVGDEVSTPNEVENIRNSALKTLALVDYVIDRDDFGHMDFLFSRRNEYLVNAEVARTVILYDLLMYRSNVNKLVEAPRGL